MERIKTEHRFGRPLGDHGVDPLGAIGRDVGQLGRPCGPQLVEEPPERLGVPSGSGPDQPAAVLVDHAGQVPVTLAVRDLIDTDPSDSTEKVTLTAVLGHDPPDQPRDEPPRRPHQLTHHRSRGAGSQPGAGVLEIAGEPGTRPGPRHCRDGDTMLTAGHPRSPGLQEHPGCAQVQRPPPTDPAALVIAPASAPTPTATTRSSTRWTHLDDQHLLVAIGFETEPLDRHPLDTEHLPPYP